MTEAIDCSEGATIAGSSPFAILVVEDAQTTSALVCSVLRRAGFCPDAVFSGHEALDWIDHNPVDLLLLDYQLPDMNALELLEKIEAGGRRIPFVGMSGHGDEKTAVEMMKRGALDYLVKEKSFLEHLPLVVRQMTARVNSENRLRVKESELLQSEGRLAAFARALPDDAYVLDQEGRCIEVLATTKERSGGIARTGLKRGQLLSECFSGTTARLLSAAAAGSAAAACTRIVEYPLALAEGERWYEGRFSPVSSDNVASSLVVWVSRDITEKKEAEQQRRELEKQLLQSQKLQAIGTLAGGIAHDFNNLLSVILGYTEISHDLLPPDAAAATNLREVLRAGHRAKDLVRQILEFSRQPDHERRPVMISALVKETVRLARATMSGEVEVRLDIEAVGCNVLANATQMHQVMMNLITNAEHAMEGTGGELRVSLDLFDAGRQFVRTRPGMEEGRYVRLQVSDCGCGMSPEVMARIFEPYFTTKEFGRGTGLGLSIVHGIVTSLRGIVTVESEVGRGSSFTVYLPHCDEAAAVESCALGSVPHGGEHILLVDDEPLLTEICQQMLEHLGYRVTVRSHGVEALAAFKADPARYDLLLTDYAMPSLDGLELARRARALRPDLPVILVTGFSRSRYLEKARSAGIHQVIMKPVIARDLALAVRSALDQDSSGPT